jgi:hypothetical protein
VVGRPADVDEVGLDDRTVLAKSGQGLNPSDCSDKYLDNKLKVISSKSNSETKDNYFTKILQ